MERGKRRWVKLGFILIALVAVMPVAGQQGASVCLTAQQLLQTIKTYHVAPVATDSLYGERVLQQLVTELDPFGLYLTQEHVAVLRPHFSNLEQQIQENRCRFAAEAVSLFSRQYRFADSLRQGMLRQPFRWDELDTMRLYINATPLAANQQELLVRWRQQLKYMLLQEAYTEAGGMDVKSDRLQAMREKVLERLNCRRSRMLKTPNSLEEYVEEHLLEAIASAFDPHTNYFPASLKQQFEASLSSEAESFGIALDENRQGDIHIEHLSPGGPAWKSNELHHGDVLISLRLTKGEEKSFACTTTEEADRLLNDANHRHIFLTVRKKDGKTKTIPLVKEKLKVEENVVQSFVLVGEKKVGYLSLPGFYTQWDENGREMGCANDVARELLKLKKEAVSGIILDLRYNTGGEIEEALNLAGIFIDEGPLGIEQLRGEKPRLRKDGNRGTLTDAPLIVLVNNFSASASEILVQALQNYNRAVIVGSKTYGKASIQTILPLAAGRKDYVKVTIGKYYNVLGSTYQYQGVVPDIVLEDGLAALGQHESSYPTALRPDRVKKQVIFQPLPELPLSVLATNSQQRLQQNAMYREQLQQAQRLFSSYGKGYQLRLTPTGFQQDYLQLQTLLEPDSIAEIQTTVPFTLQTLATTEALLQLDSEKKAAHDQVVKELLQDAWLEESYHIMLDLLVQPKN